MPSSILSRDSLSERSSALARAGPGIARPAGREIDVHAGNGRPVVLVDHVLVLRIFIPAGKIERRHIFGMQGLDVFFLRRNSRSISLSRDRVASALVHASSSVRPADGLVLISSGLTCSFRGLKSRLLIFDSRRDRRLSAVTERCRESASVTSAWSTSFFVMTPARKP